MESVNISEHPKVHQWRGAETNPETGGDNVRELRQNLREGEHAEAKSTGMSIPHGMQNKEQDDYIQSFVNEGEKAKALFATGNHQEKKRWTADEYLTAEDDPLLSANRTDSKQTKGRLQLLREGETKS